MGRPLLTVVLLAVMLALPARTVASNPNTGVAFNRVLTWTQACNDQESTATNCVTDTVTGYGACTWGDEDDIADQATGKLSAGQSVSDTLCLVTDPCSDFACPHQILYSVTGVGLSIRLTDSRGHTWTATSSSSKSPTTLCFNDPLWPQFDASVLPTIPGTNGGYGLVTGYTLTITASKTTQMSAGFEIAQNDADGRFGYWHTLSAVTCPLR